MALFESIKLLHVLCAAISIFGFFVRGIWMMQDAPILQRRWVKKIPHKNDAVLLLAAITLSVMSAQYPLQDNWLTAKLCALIAYILLGMVALRFGKSKGVRVGAWFLALLSFGYIALVAITKDAMPFF
jgi:uncharacterized membrane protein SirB2